MADVAWLEELAKWLEGLVSCSTLLSNPEKSGAVLVNFGCYVTEEVDMGKEEVFTEVSSYCSEGCSVHLAS